MKKAVTILLALTMLTGLCACGAKAPAPTFDAAALEADAEAVADALLSGDYAFVAGKFDKTMSSAVSLEALESAWVSVATVNGEHKSRESVEGAEQDGHYIVTITERFENGAGVTLRVVYDPEGQIAGLQCAPVASEAAEMSEGCVEYEVTVTADEACPLSGSLTLPDGVEKPPVVILIQGSGSSDKNESVYANKPFFDLAQGLAKLGVATLRYDKRFYAYPEAAPGSDTELRSEVLDDLDAAIELAKADGRVDSDRIFVLGHSLGGMLTPVIAVEHPELAGVISMAGSLRPLWEISYDQSQEAIAAIDKSSLSDTDKSLFEAQVAQIEADIETLRGDFSALPNDTILLGISVGYWKSLDELSGMNYIGDVKIPMLIMQGEADFQVYADKDYVLWQDTLSKREDVTFKLYPGLNHLMMPTQGLRNVNEYATPSNVDPQVIADIAAFVAAY